MILNVITNFKTNNIQRNILYKAILNKNLDAYQSNEMHIKKIRNDF